MYDDREAQAILSSIKDGSGAERLEASVALLREFEALCKGLHLTLGVDDADILVHRPIGAAYAANLVFDSKDGAPPFRVERCEGGHPFKPIGMSFPVDLVFNSQVGRWEGRKYERAIVPVPGELRKKRSALAEIADAVVMALGRKSMRGTQP